MRDPGLPGGLFRHAEPFGVDAVFVGSVSSVVVVDPLAVPLVGLLAFSEFEADFLGGCFEATEIFDFYGDCCYVAHF